VLTAIVACGGPPGHDSFPDGDGTGGGDSGAVSSSSGGSGGSSSGASSGSSGSSGFNLDGGRILGDGSLSADAGCAKAQAKATRAPVYMQFVQDGSGSMGQSHKWQAVVPALEGLFTSFEDDPGIAAGLIVFADSLDTTLTTGPGPYPEGPDVLLGYVNATQDTALVNRLSGMPNSNTPTYYALQGGYSQLEGYMPQSPVQPNGQKVLVLITDGVPTDHNCSLKQAGTNYAMNPCVLMAAAEYAKASPAGPILTFVIGVGPFPNTSQADYDPVFLGYMGQAGGGAPKNCNPNETQNPANLCYLEVDPTQATSATQLQQAFTDALQTIRGQVLSCTFPLETTGLGAVDPAKVNVQVDGTTVPQSSTNGWSYDNPTKPTSIQFNGQACDTLKSETNANVSIVLGCATVVAT
jgi:hypothetical protein